MTLGCKVNQYETAAIEGQLQNRGHELVAVGDGCDICILNTCAVTAESVRKSRQAIRRMKKLEPSALVAVCGCYSQLEPEAVKNLGADLVSGATDRLGFAQKVEQAVSGAGQGTTNASDPSNIQDSGSMQDSSGTSNTVSTPPPLPNSSTGNTSFEELPPGNTPGRTRALLKIQDGCDNYCAYCIVPYIRGRSRSLPLKKMAEYAGELKNQGYKEIIITGIEISSYGKDLTQAQMPPTRCARAASTIPVHTTHSPPPTLPEALQTISAAAPNLRLRLGSLAPSIMTDTFCEELKKIPKLCNHFHLSLQSGCDETLKRMGRKYTAEQVHKTIKTLRSHFTDCAITADLITGFPVESKEEFDQTLRFIKKAEFSDMHVFPYSQRPGTKAAKMPDQIEKSIKKERARLVIDIANEMATKFKKSQLGKTFDVLIEKEKKGISTGHTTNYLEVSVKNQTIKRNSIIKVKITELKDNRLYGEIV